MRKEVKLVTDLSMNHPKERKIEAEQLQQDVTALVNRFGPLLDSYLLESEIHRGHCHHSRIALKEHRRSTTF